MTLAKALVLGAILAFLFVYVFGGPAVMVCSILPAVLLWLLWRANSSPDRAKLEWLTRGLGIMLGLILIGALFGGFLIPVLLITGVFVGFPMFVRYACLKKETTATTDKPA